MLAPRALAVLVLLPVAGCAHARVPDGRPEAAARLEAHITVLPVAPRIVKVHAYVTDPDLVFPCPSERWEWPDGTVSYHAADCDPEVLLPYHQGRVYRLHLPPGEFSVRVVFDSSGRELAATARWDVP